MNYNSTFPYIQNILYTTVTVLLDYYSSTLVLVEDKYTYSYNKYSWFKFGIDRIFRYKRDFINYVYDIKVYPDHDWHNMINIIDLSEKFEYHEHYTKSEKVNNEQSYMKQMRGFYSSLYDNKNKKHSIEAVIDRLKIPKAKSDDFRLRLSESLENALALGEGLVKISDINGDLEESVYSSKMACSDCGANQSYKGNPVGSYDGTRDHILKDLIKDVETLLAEYHKDAKVEKNVK